MKCSRREVLLGAVAMALPGAPIPARVPVVDGVPRVDYHAHPEGGMTVDRAVALSKELGVTLGLVEHAGVKRSADSKLADSDADLNAWIDSLRGKPVFCGIQAEGLDWASAFSKRTTARLDYVLSDALTLPDGTGKPVKIYTPGYLPQNVEDFMERYVEFHSRVLSNGRLDILANPTFLPAGLMPRYEELWTATRRRKVIDAAVRAGAAMEINSRYQIPHLSFLQDAKAAGLKFSFGSNMHSEDGIGRIDFCVDTYRKLGLTMDQFFLPRRAAA